LGRGHGNQTFSPQRRKERKEKQKIAGENLQCAEAAFVASIGYPGIERHESLFHVIRVSFAFFASLR
jgi:hypothetical protein